MMEASDNKMIGGQKAKERQKTRNLVLVGNTHSKDL